MSENKYVSDWIFLVDAHDGEGKILVVGRDWFSHMPLCETYDNWGMHVESNHMPDPDDDEYEICNCSKVFAHNYHNGSNYQTVIIDNDCEYGGRYTSLESDADILKYEFIFEQKEFRKESGGYRIFDSQDQEGNPYIVMKSHWQGDFEVATILESSDPNDNQ